jgi:hypothetical protein
MGLKKGPWTPEEDQILSAHIQRHGHSNWRALPKQAGLLRCGKSCRLRWINYLRPDLKRGNFTREEEDTIIQLHDLLGNRYGSLFFFKKKLLTVLAPHLSFHFSRNWSNHCCFKRKNKEKWAIPPFHGTLSSWGPSSRATNKEKRWSKCKPLGH